MTGRIRARRYELIDLAVRTVLALALLVLHDAPLLVEFSLVDGTEQVPHTVGFQPQRGIERVDGHILEVRGAIEPRVAVHLRGTGADQRPEELVVMVLGVREHQVLKQVRKACTARSLVLAAHVIPDVHGDDWRLVVLVHDQREAVRQNVLLIWNVYIGQYTRNCTRGTGLCGYPRRHQQSQNSVSHDAKPTRYVRRSPGKSRNESHAATGSSCAASL